MDWHGLSPTALAEFNSPAPWLQWLSRVQLEQAHCNRDSFTSHSKPEADRGMAGPGHTAGRRRGYVRLAMTRTGREWDSAYFRFVMYLRRRSESR